MAIVKFMFIVLFSIIAIFTLFVSFNDYLARPDSIQVMTHFAYLAISFVAFLLCDFFFNGFKGI